MPRRYGGMTLSRCPIPAHSTESVLYYLGVDAGSSGIAGERAMRRDAPLVLVELASALALMTQAVVVRIADPVRGRMVVRIPAVRGGLPWGGEAEGQLNRVPSRSCSAALRKIAPHALGCENAIALIGDRTVACGDCLR